MSGLCKVSKGFSTNGKVVFRGIDLHRITELGFLSFVSLTIPLSLLSKMRIKEFSVKGGELRLLST